MYLVGQNDEQGTENLDSIQKKIHRLPGKQRILQLMHPNYYSRLIKVMKIKYLMPVDLPVTLKLLPNKYFAYFKVLVYVEFKSKVKTFTLV